MIITITNMKICHIITNFSNGGAEKMVVELANAQVEQNNHVSVVIFDPITAEMIQNKNLSSKVKVVLLRRTFKFDFHTILLLYIFLKKYKFDVVHTHRPSGIIHLIPLINFFKKKINFIHTVHNELSYYKNMYSMLNNISLFKKNVLNICLSEEIKGDYKKEFPTMKFVAIENGISKPKISDHYGKVVSFISKLKEDGSRVLLFIGRNAEQKNLQLLFDSMKVLINENSSCKLVCLGIDKYEIRKSYIVCDILDKNTFILGSKSNIADFIDNSDALILSSKNEGMPLVIIEALSYGKPIISTRVGSIPGMITDKENGFLSSTPQVVDMTNTINQFLEISDSKLKKMQLANNKKFEGAFSIDYCLEKHNQVYNN